MKLMDGRYTIHPSPTLALKVYCDMTRNGGGWTLIISSHTNTWTPRNVRIRNKEEPSLDADYSILLYANKIKDTYLIKDVTFQYRIEADKLGLCYLLVIKGSLHERDILTNTKLFIII